MQSARDRSAALRFNCGLASKVALIATFTMLLSMLSAVVGESARADVTSISIANTPQTIPVDGTTQMQPTTVTPTGTPVANQYLGAVSLWAGSGLTNPSGIVRDDSLYYVLNDRMGSPSIKVLDDTGTVLRTLSLPGGITGKLGTSLQMDDSGSLYVAELREPASHTWSYDDTIHQLLGARAATGNTTLSQGATIIASPTQNYCTGAQAGSSEGITGMQFFTVTPGGRIYAFSKALSLNTGSCNGPASMAGTVWQINVGGATSGTLTGTQVMSNGAGSWNGDTNYFNSTATNMQMPIGATTRDDTLWVAGGSGIIWTVPLDHSTGLPGVARLYTNQVLGIGLAGAANEGQAPNGGIGLDASGQRLYFNLGNQVRRVMTNAAPGGNSLALAGQIGPIGNVNGAPWLARFNTWGSGSLVVNEDATSSGRGNVRLTDYTNNSAKEITVSGYSFAPVASDDITPVVYRDDTGLVFNSNGSISGAVSTSVAPTLSLANYIRNYTVSYTNRNGTSASGAVQLILGIAPNSFGYQFPGTWSGNPVWMDVTNTAVETWGNIPSGSHGEFAINQAITPACPSTLAAWAATPRSSTNCGTSELITNRNLGLPTATTFSVAPALPTGMSFSTSTGRISGTPTVYAAAQNYTVTAQNAFGSATTTVSIAVPQTFTVTFSANGGSGSMSSQTAASPTTLANNTFSPPAGKAFTGWNTAANGTGTPYAAGATFPFTADTTLYAQWATAYMINFSPGAGTGSSPPEGPYLAGTQSAGIDGQPYNFTAPSYAAGDNYVFNGWNTAQNGSGTFYWPNSRMIASTDETLYAQWIDANGVGYPPLYTVTYNNNGGSWGSGTQPANTQDFLGSQPVSAPDPGMVKAGWHATGWNTAADGSGAFNQFTNDNWVIYANFTAYANWVANVTYDANSGSATGTPPTDNNDYVAANLITAAGSGSLAVPGYTFDSWNTQQNGSGSRYVPGDTFQLPVTGDTTLYAQWVVPGPTISTQPADDTRNVGQTATFSVSATASAGSLSYQWARKLSGGAWGNVPSGGTSASYTTGVLSSADDSSLYRVTVTDSNGSTTSSSARLTVITPPGVPGTPSAVASAGGATVTITAPGSGGTPSSYTVTPSPVPGSAPTTCTVTPPATSCTFSNLTNGQAYTFTSTATNAAGTSGASSASGSVTPQAAPGTPGSPAFVLLSGSSASVTWTAPGSGGPAASYTVTMSPSDDTCTVSAPTLTCTLSGLSAGRSPYTVSVRATNVGGTSSAATGTLTFAAPGTPGQPSAVASNGGATVTITAPGSGGPVSSYTVTPSPAPATSPTTCTVTPPATSCSFTNLTNGQGYTFTSTATNPVGTSGASSASSSVTPTAPPGVPGTPLAVASNGGATVTIVAPGSGGTPTSYTVTPSPAPATSPTTCTVTSPATSCSFSNLTNGQAYTFTSTATNAGGTSGASGASSSVTPLAPPGTPGTPVLVLLGATSTSVTWTAPVSGGAAASYQVTTSSGDDTCTVSAPTLTCTLSALSQGNSPYTIYVTATNVGGTSGASSAPLTFAAPGTPGQPSAVAGNGSATVTIAAPGSGGPVATYTVTPSPAPATSPTTCTVTPPATTCSFSNLTNGQSYTFTSTATNVVGTSGASAASAAVIPIPPPSIPGAPTVVAGNGSATVTVTPAGSGSTPTSYTVTPSPAPATSPTTCTVSGASGSCSFTNLTNGQSYTFTSTATNAGGTSGASGASSSVTPLATPAVPGAPTAVVASTTSATVTITPAGSGAPAATYLVTSSPGAQTCTVTSPATSCLVTGLSAAGTYTFTSTATNVGGTSSASAASTAIIMSAPGTPGAPTAVAGVGSATVTITAPGSGGTPSTYLVTSVPAGGTCTVTVPATSCTVTGLTPGTSYTFTSTATNGAGTSSSSVASNAVTPTSPAPPTPPAPVPPSAPGSVTAVAGNGSVAVSWTAPAQPGSFVVSQYVATAFPGGATCTAIAPATTCTIPGLVNGTSYTVSVAALSGAGWGPAATSSAVTPGVPAPSTPSIASVIAGNGQATVVVAPGSGGGTPTSYLVTASPGGLTCAVYAPATNCVVSGLVNGASYTFTATASGPGGTSPASAASGAVTPVAPITPTPAPLPAPLAPGQSNAQQGGQSIPVTVTPNAASNALVITDPEFTMVLRGENADGQPLPLDPGGVLVLEQDRTLRTSGSGFFPGTQVDLYMDPPATGNGSMLRAGAGAVFLGSVPTDSTGVFNGTVQIDPSIGPGDHVVQAIGVTQGNVERAMSLGIRVKEEQIARPGPVRDLTKVKARPTSVTITWKAPASDGGSPITKYKVRYRLRGQDRYQGKIAVTGFRATITGLSVGKTYYIRVKATNKAGTGRSDKYLKIRLPRL